MFLSPQLHNDNSEQHKTRKTAAIKVKVGYLFSLYQGEHFNDGNMIKSVLFKDISIFSKYLSCFYLE